MKIACLQVKHDSQFLFKLNGPAPRLSCATFEGWFRVGPQLRVMLFAWESGPAGARLRSGLYLAGDALCLMRTGDGMERRLEKLHDAALPLADLQWHHLAVAVEGTTARIYLDGKPCAERAFQALDERPVEAAGPLLWGTSLVAGEIGQAYAPRI